MVEGAAGSVGHEEVGHAVKVEVLEFHRPGPVCFSQSSHLGYFAEAPGSSVEEKVVPHELERLDSFEHRLVCSHLAHPDLLFIVAGEGHVGAEEVFQPVSIDVAGIGAHGEPGRGGDCSGGSVDEGAVAAVEVEAIRVAEIVADVEVEPAILIEIEPGGTESKAGVREAGLAGDIGKGGEFISGRGVVAKEKVGAS